MIPLKDLLADDFARSDQAMVLGDDTGKAYATNQAAAQLFGCTEEDILAGGRQLIIVHDELFDLYIKERRKYGTAVGLVSCRRGDGHIFPVLISSRQIDSSLEQPVYCISFCSVEDYVKQFGQVAEGASIGQIGTWEFLLIGQQLTVSNALRRIHEVAPDYVYDPKTLSAFFQDEIARKRMMQLVFYAIKTGRDWDDEFRVITGKGNSKWIKVRCTPVVENGKTVALRGIIQDIDAFKKLEERHRDTNVELDILLNNTKKLVSIRDENQRLLFCNAAYTALFGYEFQEFNNMTLQDLIFSEDLQLTKEMFSKAKKDKLVEGFENRIVTKSGELMDISWAISWNEHKKRMYSVGTDITGLREEKIVSSLQQIHEQEAERQQLFIELHDNICQTLAAAKIFMGNYMNYGGEENLQRSMELLTEGLDATRALAAVHIYPDLEHQSFPQAVSYFFSQINKTNSITFRSTVTGNWNGTVSVEVKVMLYRIIQELSYNILHYSKATSAEITVALEGNKILLVAADSGIGIDFSVADNQQYFARMRSRIDVLGGRFSIQSEPGKGSRVEMEFDLRRMGFLDAVRSQNMELS